jgi:hypothetical protein
MPQPFSCKSRIAFIAIVALGGCALTVPSFARGGSATHASGPAFSNSNGPNSIDRDLGRDRAADRDHRKTNTNSNALKATDHDKGHDRASDRHAR